MNHDPGNPRPTLQIAARMLADAWAGANTTSGQAALVDLVEEALAAGVLAEVTRAAMAGGNVEDPRGLAGALQDMAAGWHWRAQDGELDAGVWFLPLFAPTDEAMAWWAKPGLAAIIQRTVEGWFMAQGRRPLLVEPATRWVHPAALASVEPTTLRSLALGLMGEGGVRAMADQEWANLANLIGDTLPRPGSSARWTTQRVLPIAIAFPQRGGPRDRGAAAALWQRLTMPMGLPANAALGEPVMLRTVLAETLYQHISLHWRTQRMQEAAALLLPLPPLSSSLHGFIRHAAVGACGGGMVRVCARGPNGPLAPLDLAADWALCKGEDFLQRIIEQIRNEGWDGHETPTSHGTPIGKRIVH